MHPQNSTNPPLTPARIGELKICLRKMQEASHAFYAAAQATGNHAFIEWTGLQNEYINMCSCALEKGIDFTTANAHSGRALPVEPFQAKYIAEKLHCIYGPSLASNAVSARAFMSAITHG